MTSKEFLGEIVERFPTVSFQINGDAAIYASSSPEGDHLVRDDSTFGIWLEVGDISHQAL